MLLPLLRSFVQWSLFFAVAGLARTIHWPNDTYARTTIEMMMMMPMMSIYECIYLSMVFSLVFIVAVINSRKCKRLCQSLYIFFLYMLSHSPPHNNAGHTHTHTHTILIPFYLYFFCLSFSQFGCHQYIICTIQSVARESGS